MVGSKTPGGQVASDKFQKQQAQKEGLGAADAPGRTEGSGVEQNPGNAKLASDFGSTNVGVDAGTNTMGEKGISGVPVGSAGTSINSGNTSGGATSGGKA